MMIHPNSQVEGPELDSALERLSYHQRGNFLIVFKKNKFNRKILFKYYKGKISQVL